MDSQNCASCIPSHVYALHERGNCPSITKLCLVYSLPEKLTAKEVVLEFRPIKVQSNFKDSFFTPPSSTTDNNQQTT